MFYANDAGIVSKSAGGLDKIVTTIVTVFVAAGRTGVGDEEVDHVVMGTE